MYYTYTMSQKKEDDRLSIKANYETDYDTYYSNFAAVSHTPTELFIDFCTLSPPYNVDKDNKILNAHVVSRIVITAEVAIGLINALSEQLENHRKAKYEGSMTISAKDKGNENA